MERELGSVHVWFPKDKALKEGYTLPVISGEFSYSHDFALWMALCARASYEDEEDGKWMFIAAGFREDVRFIQKGETQAYIAVHPGGTSPFAVIVFRGTDNIRDVLTDLKLWRRNVWGRKVWGLRGSRAHRGFQDALDEVWADIVTNLRDIRKKHGAVPLHLTGHSLGAALALLAAQRLEDSEDLAPAISVVNIGCPRVGNRELGERIAESASIHRVVHASDAVPRIPPLLLGYRHVGTEHWLLPDGGEMTFPPHPKLAQRVRWLQLAHHQSYAFRQYLAVSAFIAFLLTAGIYKGLNIDLTVVEALVLFAVLWIALVGVMSILVSPRLPTPVRRWFRPHALIDHKSDLYVEELAARAERWLSCRYPYEEGKSGKESSEKY